jgi:choice-of-anchor A domain-containing protein
MRSRLFNRFSLIIGTFTVIAAAVTVLPLRGALAGPLGDFNVLTFGDFSAPSSDVEGRLYAGGNVSLSSFSVGDKLQGGLVGGDSLVAGGNLSFTSGAVYHGNIKVGGSAAGVSSSVAGGMINAGYTLTDNLGAAGLPVNFAAEQARLTGISESLGALGATGTNNFQWSQLFLTGSGTTDRQVFTVNAADLSAATNVVVQGIADGTEVVINVTGANAYMSGGLDQFFERNRENVLFNFVDAETLNLGSIGVQGSILATGADITTQWGVVWGQVVAESWDGPMQLNQVYYNGDIPTPPGPISSTEVSEPGMMAIFAIGFAGLAYTRRRRA